MKGQFQKAKKYSTYTEIQRLMFLALNILVGWGMFIKKLKNISLNTQTIQ